MKSKTIWLLCNLLDVSLHVIPPPVFDRLQYAIKNWRRGRPEDEASLMLEASENPAITGNYNQGPSLFQCLDY